MEAPGLDLGGFGNNFFEIFEEKLELISNSNFELCDGSFDSKFYICSKPKKQKFAEIVPRYTKPASNPALDGLAASGRNL